MQNIAFVFSCLACVGYNRRVHTSIGELQHDENPSWRSLAEGKQFSREVSPLRAALTTFLPALTPVAAFNSGSGSPLGAGTINSGRGAPAMSVFKLPKSTDTAAEEQAQRAAATGMSPQEYEESIRQAADAYLASDGAHVGGGGAGAHQKAGFLKQLWNVDSIPAPTDEALSDPARVLATVYEIGGPLTPILSTSVNKKLPLIPHVGIRVHGVEYFYSDHIEYRTVPVMKEMLGDRPQVTLDLGKTSMSPEEVQSVVDSLESDWTADDYNVFDKNCNHFAKVLGAKLAPKGGVPPPLLQGLMDVTERMLDSLPEWRRNLGQRVMNEVTRLVVVSWGRASKEKKEKAADKLGLDRGE